MTSFVAGVTSFTPVVFEVGFGASLVA